MDAVLMAVAGLSLAMAIGLALVVLKLLRDDRDRSEARVAALTAMSAEPAPPAPAARPLRTAAPAPRHIPVNLSTDSPSRPPQLDDLEIRPPQPARPNAARLFAEHDQPSPWGRRFAVIGALAAVLAVMAFALVSTRAPHAVSAAAKSGSATLSRASTAAADVPPLDLLSLRHAQQPQSLTITGLVQNPRNGAPLTRVVATAFVFGPDGTLLASSRAALDDTTLAPGDESPFVVTVPVTGEVSRYRIGFRAEDGRVIAHVDKRAPDALASTSR